MIQFWIQKYNRRWLALTGGLVSLSFIFTTISAPFAQANLWSERKKAAEELQFRNSGIVSKKYSNETTKDKLEPWMELASSVGLPIGQSSSLLGMKPQLSPEIIKQVMSKIKTRQQNKSSKKSQIQLSLSSELLTRIDSYGAIEKVNLVKGDHLVIFIQDAHGITGVQKNIAHLLKELTEMGVGLVGVEGSSGKLEGLEKWRSYPDKESLMGVAGYLLEKGLLTGVEVAGLSSKNAAYQYTESRGIESGHGDSVRSAVNRTGVEYYGVEDKEKYLEQVKSFKDTLKNENRVRDWVLGIGKKIKELKQLFYTVELKELDENKEGYEKGEKTLGQWLEFLSKKYGETNLQFPNISRYLNAYHLEKEINFKKVSEEQKQLLEQLSKRLSKEELMGLLEESLLYRLGRIEYRDFYEGIQERCKKAKVQITPELNKYIQYVVGVGGIDQGNLFVEAKRFEEKVIARSIQKNIDLQQLVELNKDFRLLQKALDFRLTPEEWEEYSKREEDIKRIGQRIHEISNKGLQINQENKNDLSFLSRVAFLKTIFGFKDGIKNEGLAGISQPVEELLKNVSKFNRLSHERNHIFVDKIVSRFNDHLEQNSHPSPRIRKSQIINPKNQALISDNNISVLVAGGYHSKGIEQILRDKNISYIIIRPHMNLQELNETGVGNSASVRGQLKQGYHPLNVFRKNLLPLEKMFLPEKVSLAPEPNLAGGRNAQGAVLVENSLEVITKGIGLSEDKLKETETRKGAWEGDFFSAIIEQNGRRYRIWTPKKKNKEANRLIVADTERTLESLKSFKKRKIEAMELAELNNIFDSNQEKRGVVIALEKQKILERARARIFVPLAGMIGRRIQRVRKFSSGVVGSVLTFGSLALNGDGGSSVDGNLSDENLEGIASQASISVQTRANSTELLSAPFENHSLSIKEIVNPQDQPDLVGLYAGSDADITTFLLATNVQNAVYIDMTPVYFSELCRAIRVIKEDWNKITFDDEYAISKRSHGFSSGAFGGDIHYQIAQELKSLGIKPERIQIASNQGHAQIIFPWTHPSSKAEKIYSITFVEVNLVQIENDFDVPPFLNELFQKRIDIYYQRGAFLFLGFYTKFLRRLMSSIVKEGGYLVVDDMELPVPAFQPEAGESSILEKISSSRLNYWRDVLKSILRDSYGWNQSVYLKKTISQPAEDKTQSLRHKSKTGRASPKRKNIIPGIAIGLVSLGSSLSRFIYMIIMGSLAVMGIVGMGSDAGVGGVESGGAGGGGTGGGGGVGGGGAGGVADPGTGTESGGGGVGARFAAQNFDVVSQAILLELDARYGFVEEDHPIYSYANQIFQRILEQTKSKDGSRPRLYIFKDKMVNGFALPDKSVVLGLGILDLVHTEDELASVFAHELTHVEREHHSDLLENIKNGKWTLKERIGAGRAYEVDADFIPPVAILGQAGYNPLAGETLFEHMQSEEQTEKWDLEHGSLEDRRLNLLSLRYLIDLKGIERLQKPVDSSWKEMVRKKIESLPEISDFNAAKEKLLNADEDQVKGLIERLVEHKDPKAWILLREVLSELHKEVLDETSKQQIEYKAISNPHQVGPSFSSYPQYRLTVKVDKELERKYKTVSRILSKIFNDLIPSQFPQIEGIAERNNILGSLLLFGLGIDIFDRYRYTGNDPHQDVWLIRRISGEESQDPFSFYLVDYDLGVPSFKNFYIGQQFTINLMDEDEPFEGIIKALDPGIFHSLGIYTLPSKGFWQDETSLLNLIKYAVSKDVGLFYDQGTGKFNFQLFFERTDRLIQKFVEFNRAFGNDSLLAEHIFDKRNHILDEEGLFDLLVEDYKSRGLWNVESMLKLLGVIDRGQKKLLEKFIFETSLLTKEDRTKEEDLFLMLALGQMRLLPLTEVRVRASSKAEGLKVLADINQMMVELENSLTLNKRHSAHVLFVAYLAQHGPAQFLLDLEGFFKNVPMLQKGRFYSILIEQVIAPTMIEVSHLSGDSLRFLHENILEVLHGFFDMSLRELGGNMGWCVECLNRILFYLGDMDQKFKKFKSLTLLRYVGDLISPKPGVSMDPRDKVLTLYWIHYLLLQVLSDCVGKGDDAAAMETLRWANRNLPINLFKTVSDPITMFVVDGVDMEPSEIARRFQDVIAHLSPLKSKPLNELSKDELESLLELTSLFRDPDLRRQVQDYVMNRLLSMSDLGSAIQRLFHGEYIGRFLRFGLNSVNYLVEEIAQTVEDLEMVKSELLELYKTEGRSKVGVLVMLEGTLKYCFERSRQFMHAALATDQDEAPLLDLGLEEWWSRLFTGGILKNHLDATALGYMEDPKAIEAWITETIIDATSAGRKKPVNLADLETEMEGDGMEESGFNLRGPDISGLIGVSATAQKLYDAGVIELQVILRKMLTDSKSGLLRNKESAMELASFYLDQHVDVAQAHRPAIKQILNSLVCAANLEELYHPLSHLLAGAILRKPEERADVRLVVREFLMKQDYFNRPVKKGEEGEEEKTIWERSLKVPVIIDGREILTEGDALVEKVVRWAFGEQTIAEANNSAEREIFQNLPEEYRRPQGGGKLSEMEAIKELGQMLGAVGTRLLQVLGQYIEIPEEMQREFSQVYDDIKGQSKLSAYETIKREWPNFNDKLVRRLGGGSLVTAYLVKRADGSQYTLKVLNPNAESRIRETIDLINRVLDHLLNEDPENKIYQLVKNHLLPDIERWLLADIHDNKFMENDQKFKKAYHGWTDGSAHSIYVPQSFAPNTYYLKAEEYIKGINLTQITIGDRDDYKNGVVTQSTYQNIISLISKNYMAQVNGKLGLIHSDAHEGNFRLMPDGRLAVLDRNFYIELSKKDQDLIRKLTNVSWLEIAKAGGQKDQIAQDKLDQLLDYLFSFEENSGVKGNRKEITQRIFQAYQEEEKLEKLMTVEGLSSLIVELKKEGLFLPLQLTLLFKNLNALNGMAKKAGFTNLAQSLNHKSDIISSNGGYIYWVRDWVLPRVSQVRGFSFLHKYTDPEKYEKNAWWIENSLFILFLGVPSFIFLYLFIGHDLLFAFRTANLITWSAFLLGHTFLVAGIFGSRAPPENFWRASIISLISIYVGFGFTPTTFYSTDPYLSLISIPTVLMISYFVHFIVNIFPKIWKIVVLSSAVSLLSLLSAKGVVALLQEITIDSLSEAILIEVVMFFASLYGFGYLVFNRIYSRAQKGNETILKILPWRAHLISFVVNAIGAVVLLALVMSISSSDLDLIYKTFPKLFSFYTLVAHAIPYVIFYTAGRYQDLFYPSSDKEGGGGGLKKILIGKHPSVTLEDNLELVRIAEALKIDEIESEPINGKKIRHKLVKYKKGDDDQAYKILAKYKNIDGAYHYIHPITKVRYVFVQEGFESEDFARKHELYEIYWEEKLGLKGKIAQRLYHIFAWINQLAAENITSIDQLPFLKRQIEDMGMFELDYFVNEDRKEHKKYRAVDKKGGSYFKSLVDAKIVSAGQMKNVEKFEASVHEYSERRLKEKFGLDAVVSESQRDAAVKKAEHADQLGYSVNDVARALKMTEIAYIEQILSRLYSGHLLLIRSSELKALCDVFDALISRGPNPSPNLRAKRLTEADPSFSSRAEPIAKDGKLLSSPDSSSPPPTAARGTLSRLGKDESPPPSETPLAAQTNKDVAVQLPARVEERGSAGSQTSASVLRRAERKAKKFKEVQELRARMVNIPSHMQTVRFYPFEYLLEVAKKRLGKSRTIPAQFIVVGKDMQIPGIHQFVAILNNWFDVAYFLHGIELDQISQHTRFRYSFIISKSSGRSPISYESAQILLEALKALLPEEKEKRVEVELKEGMEIPPAPPIQSANFAVGEINPPQLTDPEKSLLPESPPALATPVKKLEVVVDPAHPIQSLNPVSEPAPSPITSEETSAQRGVTAGDILEWVTGALESKDETPTELDRMEQFIRDLRTRRYKLRTDEIKKSEKISDTSPLLMPIDLEQELTKTGLSQEAIDLIRKHSITIYDFLEDVLKAKTKDGVVIELTFPRYVMDALVLVSGLLRKKIDRFRSSLRRITKKNVEKVSEFFDLITIESEQPIFFFIGGFFKEKYFLLLYLFLQNPERMKNVRFVFGVDRAVQKLYSAPGYLTAHDEIPIWADIFRDFNLYSQEGDHNKKQRLRANDLKRNLMGRLNRDIRRNQGLVPDEEGSAKVELGAIVGLIAVGVLLIIQNPMGAGIFANPISWLILLYAAFRLIPRKYRSLVAIGSLAAMGLVGMSGGLGAGGIGKPQKRFIRKIGELLAAVETLQHSDYKNVPQELGLSGKGSEEFLLLAQSMELSKGYTVSAVEAAAKFVRAHFTEFENTPFKPGKFLRELNDERGLREKEEERLRLQSAGLIQRQIVPTAIQRQTLPADIQRQTSLPDIEEFLMDIGMGSDYIRRIKSNPELLKMILQDPDIARLFSGRGEKKRGQKIGAVAQRQALPTEIEECLLKGGFGVEAVAFLKIALPSLEHLGLLIERAIMIGDVNVCVARFMERYPLEESLSMDSVLYRKALKNVVKFANESESNAFARRFTEIAAEKAAELHHAGTRENQQLPHRPSSSKPSDSEKEGSNLYVDLTSGSRFLVYMDSLRNDLNYHLIDSSFFVTVFLNKMLELLGKKNVTVVQQDIALLEYNTGSVGTIHVQNLGNFFIGSSVFWDRVSLWLEEGGQIIFQVDPTALVRDRNFPMVDNIYRDLIEKEGWGFEYKVGVYNDKLSQMTLDTFVFTKPRAGKRLESRQTLEDYLREVQIDLRHSMQPLTVLALRAFHRAFHAMLLFRAEKEFNGDPRMADIPVLGDVLDIQFNRLLYENSTVHQVVSKHRPLNVDTAELYFTVDRAALYTASYLYKRVQELSRIASGLLDPQSILNKLMEEMAKTSEIIGRIGIHAKDEYGEPHFEDVQGAIPPSLFMEKRNIEDLLEGALAAGNASKEALNHALAHTKIKLWMTPILLHKRFDLILKHFWDKDSKLHALKAIEGFDRNEPYGQLSYSTSLRDLKNELRVRIREEMSDIEPRFNYEHLQTMDSVYDQILKEDEPLLQEEDFVNFLVGDALFTRIMNLVFLESYSLPQAVSEIQKGIESREILKNIIMANIRDGQLPELFDMREMHKHLQLKLNSYLGKIQNQSPISLFIEIWTTLRFYENKIAFFMEQSKMSAKPAAELSASPSLISEQTKISQEPAIKSSLSSAGIQKQGRDLRVKNLSDQDASDLMSKLGRGLEINDALKFAPIKIGNRTFEVESYYSDEYLMRLLRIGPLIFIEVPGHLYKEMNMDPQILNERLQLLKMHLGHDYLENQGNIFFTRPSRYSAAKLSETEYSDESPVFNLLQLNPNTMLAIAAMLAYPEQFENEIFPDYGAGDGLLSRVALRLGASQAVLFELDTIEFERARVFLKDECRVEANGSNDGDYRILVEDLRDPYFADKFKNDDRIRNTRIGAANLGSPDAYANADQNVIDLILQLSEMKFFISAGYNANYPSDEAALMDTINRVKGSGFQIEPFEYYFLEGTNHQDFIKSAPQKQNSFKGFIALRQTPPITVNQPKSDSVAQNLLTEEEGSSTPAKWKRFGLMVIMGSLGAVGMGFGSGLGGGGVGKSGGGSGAGREEGAGTGGGGGGGERFKPKKSIKKRDPVSQAQRILDKIEKNKGLSVAKQRASLKALQKVVVKERFLKNVKPPLMRRIVRNMIPYLSHEEFVEVEKGVLYRTYNDLFGEAEKILNSMVLLGPIAVSDRMIQILMQVILSQKREILERVTTAQYMLLVLLEEILFYRRALKIPVVSELKKFQAEKKRILRHQKQTGSLSRAVIRSKIAIESQEQRLLYLVMDELQHIKAWMREHKRFSKGTDPLGDFMISLVILRAWYLFLTEVSYLKENLGVRDSSFAKLLSDSDVTEARVVFQSVAKNLYKSFLFSDGVVSENIVSMLSLEEPEAQNFSSIFQDITASALFLVIGIKNHLIHNLRMLSLKDNELSDLQAKELYKFLIRFLKDAVLYYSVVFFHDLGCVRQVREMRREIKNSLQTIPWEKYFLSLTRPLRKLIKRLPPDQQLVLLGSLEKLYLSMGSDHVSWEAVNHIHDLLPDDSSRASFYLLIPETIWFVGGDQSLFRDILESAELRQPDAILDYLKIEVPQLLMATRGDFERFRRAIWEELYGFFLLALSDEKDSLSSSHVRDELGSEESGGGREDEAGPPGGLMFWVRDWVLPKHLKTTLSPLQYRKDAWWFENSLFYIYGAPLYLLFVSLKFYVTGTFNLDFNEYQNLLWSFFFAGHIFDLFLNIFRAKAERAPPLNIVFAGIISSLNIFLIPYFQLHPIIAVVCSFFSHYIVNHIIKYLFPSTFVVLSLLGVVGVPHGSGGRPKKDVDVAKKGKNGNVSNNYRSGWLDFLMTSSRKASIDSPNKAHMFDKFLRFQLSGMSYDTDKTFILERWKKYSKILLERGSTSQTPYSAIPITFLSPAFVEHAIAVKRIVNPENRALVGIYGAAGGDFSSYLLATNAIESYFVDKIAVDSKKLERLIKDKWDSIPLDTIYAKHKWYGGFAHFSTIEDIYEIIIQELKLIGVEKESIEVTVEQGNTKISFDWQHPDSNFKQRYHVTYINADITEIGSSTLLESHSLLNWVLQNGIDLYYQRAAQTVPFEYHKFMWRIGKALKVGGYTVSDDYTSSGLYIDPTRHLMMGGSKFSAPIITRELDSIKRRIPYRLDGYGWDLTIRRKESDLPSNRIHGKRISFSDFRSSLSDNTLHEPLSGNLLNPNHGSDSTLVSIGDKGSADILPPEDDRGEVALLPSDLSKIQDPSTIFSLSNHTGVLSVPYEEHAKAVKEVVNPNNNPSLVGLYAAAGADLSSFLLSTNVERAYFVDQEWINPMKLSRAIEDYWDTISFTDDYSQYKRENGHAYYLTMGDIHKRIVQELKGLGVRKETIDVQEVDGYTTISFFWTYPGSNMERRYSITYIKKDMTKIYKPGHLRPDSLLYKVLDQGIDIYYQRAGMNMESHYFKFLWRIGYALKLGGYVLSDEYLDDGELYYWLGGTKVEDVKFSKFIVTELIQSWVEFIKRYKGQGEYGWNMKIYKKEKDLNLSKAEKDELIQQLSRILEEKESLDKKSFTNILVVGLGALLAFTVLGFLPIPMEAAPLLTNASLGFDPFTHWFNWADRYLLSNSFLSAAFIITPLLAVVRRRELGSSSSFFNDLRLVPYDHEAQERINRKLHNEEGQERIHHKLYDQEDYDRISQRWIDGEISYLPSGIRTLDLSDVKQNQNVQSRLQLELDRVARGDGILALTANCEPIKLLEEIRETIDSDQFALLVEAIEQNKIFTVVDSEAPDKKIRMDVVIAQMNELGLIGPVEVLTNDHSRFILSLGTMNLVTIIELLYENMGRSWISPKQFDEHLEKEHELNARVKSSA